MIEEVAFVYIAAVLVCGIFLPRAQLEEWTAGPYALWRAGGCFIGFWLSPLMVIVGLLYGVWLCARRRS